MVYPVFIIYTAVVSITSKIIPSIHSRCARLAREKRFLYFGLQFYGECWSGDHSENLFATKKSNQCMGHGYEDCTDSTETACSGKAGHNYVYEIVYEGNHYISA